jgi:hypothetical protein
VVYEMKSCSPFETGSNARKATDLPSNMTTAFGLHE